MVIGFNSEILSGDKISVSWQDIATSATITAMSSSKGSVRFTGSTATEVQGILSGIPGQIIDIYNYSSALVTFKHQNSGASESNRIITPSGGDEELSPQSSVSLVYDSGASRWILKLKALDPNLYYYRRNNAAGFTRASTSTITVTDNTTNQTIFSPGLPVRYKEVIGDDWLYGIIKSYSSGTVTISGMSIPSTLADFQVGPSSKIINLPIQISGDLKVEDDVLKTVMYTSCYWKYCSSYLVCVTGQVESAASGANLNINIANNSANRDVFSSSINLGQAASIVDSGITPIAYRYKFGYGMKIFINVDQIGSSSPGSDLTVYLIFSVPDSATIAALYGFYGGGISNNRTEVINYLDLSVLSGNASDSGDLTSARNNPAGVSSKIDFGFYGGGSPNPGVDSDAIDYTITPLKLCNGSSKGTLTLGRTSLTGVSGVTYGFYAGGNPSTNIIDYINMTTISGNATDRGDLPMQLRYLCGLSGPTYGYFGGGTNSDGYDQNVISYIDMGVLSGNSIDRGDLIESRRQMAGVSGPTYGFFGGGQFSDYLKSTIEYLDVTITTGNGASRGNCPFGANQRAGASGSLYGFYGGGYDGGTRYNNIDYVDMSLTSGNSIDRGDIPQTVYAMAGVNG